MVHMWGWGGGHPDHRLQQAYARGCTVRTVWCCRRAGPRHCTSPARMDTWSAWERCWIGVRQSAMRRWVAQPGWQSTAGSVCVRGCAGGTVHACVACGVRWDGTRLSVRASSGGVYVIHVGMGRHPDHRLQQTSCRGCTVRTMWCCRRRAGHRFTPPARMGTWSARGLCWIGARRSTRRRWVAQPGWQSTSCAVCVLGCAGGTVNACVVFGVRWDGTRWNVDECADEWRCPCRTCEDGAAR
jgi:hypothetical protein